MTPKPVHARATAWPAIFLFLTLLAYGAFAQALPPWERDDGELLRLPDGRTFQAAELADAEPPKYPYSRAVSAFEGWVALAFVVTAEGAVRDVQVLDSSGDREFEDAAVAAARQFRYEPARIDGEPVEQAVPTFRIIFRLDEEGSPGITPAFRRRAREIGRMIETGRIDAAHEALASFAERPRRTLAEDAIYWWLRAAHDGARGDTLARQESLRRAVAIGDTDDTQLPGEYYLDALGMLYAEYARAGELHSALETYERIAKHLEPDAPPANLTAHAGQIRAVLASDAELLARAQLQSYPWVHRLTRNSFQFVHVEGHLHSFNLWCDRRAQQLEASVDAAWFVPAAWGACTLILNGEPGTRFGIWEYDQEPPESPNGGPTPRIEGNNNE
jgi:TonB family protein